MVCFAGIIGVSVWNMRIFPCLEFYDTLGVNRCLLYLVVYSR